MTTQVLQTAGADIAYDVHGPLPTAAQSRDLLKNPRTRGPEDLRT